MDRDLARRRRVLFVMLTALAFRYPPGGEPELVEALRRWLSGWPGLGRVATGMGRHGYDLVLSRYGGEGWRATFYPAGRAHSATRAAGSGWAPTPWAAAAEAAWETLRRAEGAA